MGIQSCMGLIIILLLGCASCEMLFLDSTIIGMDFRGDTNFQTFKQDTQEAVFCASNFTTQITHCVGYSVGVNNSISNTTFSIEPAITDLYFVQNSTLAATPNGTDVLIGKLVIISLNRFQFVPSYSWGLLDKEYFGFVPISKTAVIVGTNNSVFIGDYFNEIDDVIVARSDIPVNGTYYWASSQGLYYFRRGVIQFLPFGESVNVTFLSTFDGQKFLIGSPKQLYRFTPNTPLTLITITLSDSSTLAAAYVDTMSNFTYVPGVQSLLFKIDPTYNNIERIPGFPIVGSMASGLAIPGFGFVGVALSQVGGWFYAIKGDKCVSTCPMAYCYSCGGNCTQKTFPCSAPTTSSDLQRNDSFTSRSTSTSPQELLSPEVFNDNTGLIVGVVLGLVFLIAIIILVVLYLVYRRKKIHKSSHHPQPRDLELSPVDSKKYSIEYSDLKIQENIGEGAFGTVYKAIWRSSPVAVKKLKVEAMKQDVLKQFVAEVALMKDLRPHLNVVNFLGVCSEPLCVVTEFCTRGSLHSAIREDLIEPEKIPGIISGISSGMHHLASEGIVHRDLAARNILLGDGFVPKVADFGMSRLVGEDGGDYLSSNNFGPIKWMSPESIMNRVFNEKSDVWSFGVLILEILTKQHPFPGMNAADVAVKFFPMNLPDQLRSSVPSGTSILVRDVVMACLSDLPEDRPSFAEICTMMDVKVPIRVEPISPKQLSAEPENYVGVAHPEYGVTKVVDEEEDSKLAQYHGFSTGIYNTTHNL